MSKTPTAEEHLQKYFNTENITNISKDIVVERMIEFAKLHVQAAIKECIESAPSGSSTDTVSYEDVVNALTDCYPLNKIQ